MGLLWALSLLIKPYHSHFPGMRKKAGLTFPTDQVFILVIGKRHLLNAKTIRVKLYHFPSCCESALEAPPSLLSAEPGVPGEGEGQVILCAERICILANCMEPCRSGWDQRMLRVQAPESLEGCH